MTQLGGESLSPTSGAPQNPGAAVAAVVDSVSALARAELRLAATEARPWLTRAVIGVVLLWLSLLLVQVFVVLLAISPLMFVSRPWPSVVACLLISLLLAGTSAGFAARELRKLKEVGPHVIEHESERH